jgi:flagellar L-ring protein precursor FlgH
MKFKKLSLLVISYVMASNITGCVAPSAMQQPLLETDTTAAPQVRPPPSTSVGSLTPQSSPLVGEYTALVGGRRASLVGDTLTVIFDEVMKASQDGGKRTSRKTVNNFDAGLNYFTRQIPQTTPGTSNDYNAGLDARSDMTFSGMGGSTASNQFKGTITATVVEVLPNGNLRLAGEKRIAIGTEEEIIRIGGVVSPRNITRNTVYSSRLADARIEYRGAGAVDLVKQPGWLTRLLLRASPN